MAICADQKDYKNGYRKHLHAFRNWQTTGSDTSKRLILVYCVECGLKCLLMVKKGIQRVEDAQPDIQQELHSHDFQKMLKSLNQVGLYSFPPIPTMHGDHVLPDTYHQLCRYAIRPINDDMSLINSYDDQLQQIANWLEGKL